jgi:hypothetical protein
LVLDRIVLLLMPFFYLFNQFCLCF